MNCAHLFSLGNKVENIFHQTVNLIVHKELLKEHFAVERAPKSIVEAQFPKDELNGLQYASGYVPMKLLKRYEKKGEKGWERLSSLKCACCHQ